MTKAEEGGTVVVVAMMTTGWRHGQGRPSEEEGRRPLGGGRGRREDAGGGTGVGVDAADTQKLEIYTHTPPPLMSSPRATHRFLSMPATTHHCVRSDGAAPARRWIAGDGCSVGSYDRLTGLVGGPQSRSTVWSHSKKGIVLLNSRLAQSFPRAE